MAQPAEPIIDHDKRRLWTALWPPAIVVLFMWLVLGFDLIFHLDLARFGILPRTWTGLRGILFSPFIHAGVAHLFSNSAPLLVLGWLTVYFYPKASGRVVLVSWLATGLWVWAMGRPSHHIGASGMVYALAAFLFLSGVLRRQVALMAVSLIVVFLYGGLWWGVLPIQPGVSWESHLFGGVVGLWMAWWYRKVPPAHVPPPRTEEDEPDGLEADEDLLLSGTDPGDEQDAPSLREPRQGFAGYDPERTNSTWR